MDVQVVNVETTISLECGGEVTVRKLTRSRMGAVLRRVPGYSPDNPTAGDSELFGQLSVRVACVRWSSVPGIEDKSATNKGVREDGLGEVAPVELYDALSDADLGRVFALAMRRQGVTEDAEKKSAPSLSASTGAGFAASA